MKVLSAGGIVDVRRGAGTYISTSENQNIFDPLLFRILVSNPDDQSLVEVRELMEKGIVGLILENANEEDYRRLAAIQREFDVVQHESTIDKSRGDELDLEYHRVMGEVTHNNIVSNMYNFIIDLFAPTIKSTAGYKAHGDLHQAIMDIDLQQAIKTVENHTQTWTHSR